MAIIKRFLGCALVAGMASISAADTTTNTFGFTGPEIFPIDNDIALLHAADINGDGLNDLIVVNNARSKIDILYNQTGSTNLTAKADSVVKPEINDLPPDARFRIESIASEKRIAALVTEDLNGDGRPDIAYYGMPKELIVLYNEGTNGWSAPKRWPIDDGRLDANSLTTGDLNGDKRTDLILLGETSLYLLTQGADHTLEEPKKIPFSGDVKAAQVLDVDGDGRSDLLLVNWESLTPFRFRLQDETGQLGAEHYFSLPPIRSYLADQLEQNQKTYVVTIALNSGRAQISDFTRKPAEALSGSFHQGEFQVLPLSKTDKSRRGLLWADVDGDGLADLLVPEPESGQITISLQRADGSLAPAKKFSTLAGVTDLAVADWDGDGKPEIFMLSADERQVGVTRFDGEGRLPFPTLIPVDGKPLAIAVGSLKSGAKPTLAVIADSDGKRSLVMRSADGKSTVKTLDESFKSNPSTLAFHDVNQDGLNDLVVLIPYEKVKVLLQNAGGDGFSELDVAPPGGVLEQPWLATADVDGDGKSELLLSQKNFLRAVVLSKEASDGTSTNKSSWTFKVKEQINGANSNSRLVAAAAVPNGSNPIPSLFLLDAEAKALTLCERDKSGVWQVVRNIQLPVSDFSTLQPLALGGKDANSVAFMGLNSLAWMSLKGDVWEFKELGSYETPIKDGYLHDVVSGDLNNDGRKDLVFMETAKNYLDLVLFSADHKLVPANRWQVFEQRTYRSGRGGMAEPREALVSDVTGDKKNDLVIIVHDRILLYPQE